MSDDPIVVCSKCGRSVRAAMCKALEALKGRKRYICRGLMRPSCERIAGEKAELETPQTLPAVE